MKFKQILTLITLLMAVGCLKKAGSRVDGESSNSQNGLPITLPSVASTPPPVLQPVALPSEPPTIFATIYYVDFDGPCSDSNSGLSRALPWCTVPGTRTTTGSAFLRTSWGNITTSNKIQPSTAIYIKSGSTHTSARGGRIQLDSTYFENGSAGNRIMISADPNWNPPGAGKPYAKIDAKSMTIADDAIVRITDLEYITVNGLEIFDTDLVNYFASGVQFDSNNNVLAPTTDVGVRLPSIGKAVAISGTTPSHIRITNGKFHDMGSTSVLFITGPSAGTKAMSVIADNEIYNGLGGGITLWNSKGGYYLIANNVVHGMYGSGNFDSIQVGGGGLGEGGRNSSNHVVVKNNIVYDHCPQKLDANKCGDPLDMGGHDCHTNYIAEKNYVYNSYGAFKFHGNSAGSCKAVGPYIDPVTKESRVGEYGLDSYGIARFNILNGVGHGEYTFPNTNVYYNNTIYNAGAHALLYWNATDDVLNGIILESLGTPKYTGSPSLDTDNGRYNYKNNILWNSSSYLIALAGNRCRNTRCTEDEDFYSVKRTPDSLMFQKNLLKGGPERGLGYRAPLDIVSTVDASLTFADISALQTNPSNRDSLRLTSTSADAINNGASLTYIKSCAGSLITVDRASYFTDGYDGLTEPDSIMIADRGPFKIVKVDDENNTINLDSSVTCAPGEPVNLPFKGTAPDIGAFEFEQ